MATTYNNATGDGNEKNFTYTFPTIEETNTTANTNSEVKVALDGITQAANRYTVHTNPAKIQFNNTNGVDSTVQEADGAPKSAVKVRVYRDTDVDSASVVFAAGSSIRAQDLNTITDQGLYHDQEQQNQLILAEHIDEGAVTSVKIKNDTIVNEDINTAADIVVSKLKDGNAREVLQTGTDGDTVEWTPSVDLSGTLDVAGAVDFDTTLNVDGATTIQDDLIVKSDNKEFAVQNAAGTDKFTVDTDNGNTVIAGNVSINGVTGSGDSIVALGGATFAGDVNVGAANLTIAADNKEFRVQNAAGANKFTVDTDNGNTVITGSLTAASITGDAIETASTSTSDTKVYSAKYSDTRYYNINSSDDIQHGETWDPTADDKVATCKAIDKRVLDLVDDVGGFYPIANETSFPTHNPDPNDGPGTIISIRTMTDTREPTAGVVTIDNGAGTGVTVTIVDCGTDNIPQGYGVLVETTSTLHNYQFHRLTPKATEVSALAPYSTELQRLGTAAAVEDMSLLGTTECVADMALLGTADVVSDLNTLGTADVVADLNTLATADVVSDMNTLATSANVTAMSNVSDSIANVNTVASNLTNVNNFADLYQIDDFDPNPPTTDGGGNSLAAGDLAFDTTADELKVYNGSSWQAGVTATGNLVQKSAVTTKGDILAAQGNANPVRLGVGSDGQVLKADSSTSSGLVWGTVASSDTTYDFSVEDHGSSTGSGSGNDCTLRLDPSTGSNDDVRLIAGTNVTLTKGTGTITIESTDTNTQVAIDDTPVDGVTDEAISSNWAYDHNAGTGNGKHVPAAGSSGQFLKHDGTWGTPPDTTTPADDSVTGAKLNISLVEGDIIYASGTDTLARLAKGSAGQALIMNSGADAPEWGAAGATIANDANNRVITADGSAGLNGEANLTFDGSTLAVTGNQTVSTTLAATGQITGRGFECPHEVSDDWTIAAGNNAMFPGPMTVATGKTVTVPSGRTLTVV